MPTQSCILRESVIFPHRELQNFLI